MSDKALHIVTPLKFYHNIPISSPPGNQPMRNEAAQRYFQDNIAYWRDEFEFDFLRYDSADHILDSVVGGNPDFPASDRVTPSILQDAIAASRSQDKPFIGNLAERMGNETAEYASMGFDLMLGSDMAEHIDREHLEKSFKLYDDLAALNAGRAVPFSVVYALDTHDTRDPKMGGAPLLYRVGSEGMLLRQFISRFIGCGNARRPKYEVMGLQDMSYGLYDANVKEMNIVWIGDEAHCTAYHRLEDLYQQFRSTLNEAEMVHCAVTDAYAWWIIEAKSCLLIPLIALENSASLNGASVQIEFQHLVHGRRYVLKRYDFKSDRGESLQQHNLSVQAMKYPGFVLYEVVFEE
jgi:hypothetical protein